MRVNRRSFIAAAGSSVTAVLAGCRGRSSDEEQTEDPRSYTIDSDADRYSMGESFEYAGLEYVVRDPVLVDHYAAYNCGEEEQVIEDDDPRTDCRAPSISDFQDPPTEGGQFIAFQITTRQVGERRIDIPTPMHNFDLIHNSYRQQEYFIQNPWVASQFAFPSYPFFIREYGLNTQGVFPGVAVRGYIAFEVPVQANPDDFTLGVTWSGNSDTYAQLYWDVTSDGVTDLTGIEKPDQGDSIVTDQRPGGIDWPNADVEPDEYETNGFSWSFNGSSESPTGSESESETATPIETPEESTGTENETTTETPTE